MKARRLAAIAVTIGAIAVAVAVAVAVDDAKAADPLAAFAGQWAGGGSLTLNSGSRERLRCRGTNVTSGNSLTLNLRCASDASNFVLASEITYDNGNISGSWSETTRGVMGSLSGKASGSQIHATATAAGFSAALAITSRGGSQSVSIRSPGSEITEVSVSLSRARSR
jgi:hypothetical protein